MIPDVVIVKSSRVRLWAAAVIPLLLLALLIAAIVRFDRARADGLTFDEIWHVELSTGRGSPQISLPTNVLIPNAPSAIDCATIRFIRSSSSGVGARFAVPMTISRIVL